MTAPSNAYLYLDLTSVSDYTIQTGDYLEYDVYWTASDDLIAFDYTCTDAATLRGAGAVDQNGIDAHPGTSFSAYALGTWYHRKIALPAGHVGKTISYYDIACENDVTSTHTGYLANILITNGSGTTRKTIYTSGSFTYAVHLNSRGAVLSFSNITLTPSCSITSPVSGAGTTYNNQPFILINGQDSSYSINDVRIVIDDSSDFLSPVYDVWASYDTKHSEFSDLGTGTDITMRHRVDTSLSNGSYYMRAMVWNSDTIDRMSAWSAACQFSITADPSWDTITYGETVIKTSHFNNLQDAIQQLNDFRGTTETWSSDPLASTGGLIRIGHLNDLRDAITLPYNAATGSDPSFTSPDPMTSGNLIRSIHIEELRDDTELP
ncbi:MAG: hypothetical protein JXJ19_05645 [Elusimicrobia bacterium]|nr:hypothetical protein [Elusimicrobiota bacterium]